MKTSSFTRFIAALGLFAQSAVTLHAGTLQSASPTASDRFGMDVSNVGSLGVVITSPTSAVGSVGYVFNPSSRDLNSPGTTTPDKTLLRNDGSAGGFYLLSASMSGNNTLLSGSFSNAPGYGAAYLYRNIDAAGTIQNQQASLFSNTAVADSFGHDASLDGDLALVGAPGSTLSRAYVFRNMSTATGTVYPSTRLELTTSDLFGFNVSLSGTTGLVSGSQAAYLFRGLNTAGAVMNPTAKLAVPGTGSANFPLSLSGSVALVANAGNVFVYPFLNSVTGTVGPTYTFTAGTTGDNFGSSVSLDGDLGLIGAPGSNSNRGAVYLFQNLTGATPAQVLRIWPSQGASGDSFGSRVSLQGDNFVVANGTNSGKAYSSRLGGFTTLDLNGALRATAGLSFSSKVDWVIGEDSNGNFANLSAGDQAFVSDGGAATPATYIGRYAGSDNNQLIIEGFLQTGHLHIGSKDGNTGNELTVESTGTLSAGNIQLAAGNRLVLFGNRAPFSALSSYLQLNENGSRKLRTWDGSAWTEVTTANNATRVAVTYNASTNYTTVTVFNGNPTPVFETIPVFGQVQVLPQANRFRSTIYGELEFANGGSDRTQAISHSLGTSLQVQNGTIHSPLYGNLTPNPWNVDDWVVSQFFGLVHFAQDAAQYGGWVNSERFDWMKFEKSGDNSFLWVHHLQTWLAINADGSFHSFDFGWMTPQAGSLTRYNTRIGMVTADPANPRGWLTSDRFGFVWFARDGSAVWFWSDNRSEWLGVTAGGGIWSTAERRFL